MAAVFAAVFIALYIGHALGDHWVQTSCQAATKGQAGWTGRLACGRHCLSLGVEAHEHEGWQGVSAG
ncbi:hypothetical protein ACIOHF_31195 [Streptomyces albidoflavus]